MKAKLRTLKEEQRIDELEQKAERTMLDKMDYSEVIIYLSEEERKEYYKLMKEVYGQ